MPAYKAFIFSEYISRDAVYKIPQNREMLKHCSIYMTDGVTVWFNKSWEYLLHECYSSVYSLCARIERGP